MSDLTELNIEIDTRLMDIWATAHDSEFVRRLDEDEFLRSNFANATRLAYALGARDAAAGVTPWSIRKEGEA